LTQQALAKLEKFPALLCDGAVSCLFLTIDATDEAFSMFHTKRGRWLLAEVLLHDLQKRPTILPTPRKINMEPENFSPGKWKKSSKPSFSGSMSIFWGVPYHRTMLIFCRHFRVQVGLEFPRFQLSKNGCLGGKTQNGFQGH